MTKPKALAYWPVGLIYIGSIFMGLLLAAINSHHTFGYSFMNGFMGGFFILFGIIKLKDIKGFQRRFITYDLISKRIPIYGYLFPFIEIIVGILYLFLHSTILNGLVVLLSIIGVVSVYASIVKKQRLYCACLGTAFNVPLSYVAIFENITMLAMALLMIFLGY